MKRYQKTRDSYGKSVQQMRDLIPDEVMSHWKKNKGLLGPLLASMDGSIEVEENWPFSLGDAKEFWWDAQNIIATTGGDWGGDTVPIIQFVDMEKERGEK